MTGGRRWIAAQSTSVWMPRGGHFWTWKVVVPSTDSSPSMVAWTTEIPVITAMIEATPAMIPTRVRAERSLWARIASPAILNASNQIIGSPPGAHS